jgi:hypothetical protein
MLGNTNKCIEDPREDNVPSQFITTLYENNLVSVRLEYEISEWNKINSIMR